MDEEHTTKASLGCGTLIVIAIIVAVFSGQKDHERLEEKIDALTKEVRELREEIKKQ